MTDFIIVLRNKSAVETFSGNVHLSVGAGLSAAAGSIGRVAAADVRAGDGGYAACYTYSCSKGEFYLSVQPFADSPFLDKMTICSSMDSSQQGCTENLADTSLNLKIERKYSLGLFKLHYNFY